MLFIILIILNKQILVYLKIITSDDHAGFKSRQSITVLNQFQCIDFRFCASIYCDTSCSVY